ncbi:MAG: class I SAM-dependent methyltransferase [Candidatus Omnitrophica bacterium]|nr:class I SAM-dependent methyltransferase [Candidatus Omnitrophota bacterium]
MLRHESGRNWEALRVKRPNDHQMVLDLPEDLLPGNYSFIILGSLPQERTMRDVLYIHPPPVVVEEPSMLPEKLPALESPPQPGVPQPPEVVDQGLEYVTIVCLLKDTRRPFLPIFYYSSLKRRLRATHQVLLSVSPAPKKKDGIWSAAGRSGRAGAHYETLRSFLPPKHLQGRVLDAGCGPGWDAAAMAAGNGASLVAVDLSWDAVRLTHRRLGSLRGTGVVQADLESLPFREGTFDFVYSYGVLHHLPDADRGFEELARVVRPGGMLAVYVYEDFSDKSALERTLLRWVSLLRGATTLLPPRWLYALCRTASPAVFLLFTIPHRILRSFRATRGLSERIPFRHGSSWFSLTGDLYDRFAAPIENRYSERQVESWFQEAGLRHVQVVPKRGWVAFGCKP